RPTRSSCSSTSTGRPSATSTSCAPSVTTRAATAASASDQSPSRRLGEGTAGRRPGVGGSRPPYLVSGTWYQVQVLSTRYQVPISSHRDEVRVQMRDVSQLAERERPPRGDRHHLEPAHSCVGLTEPLPFPRHRVQPEEMPEYHRVGPGVGDDDHLPPRVLDLPQ